MLEKIKSFFKTSWKVILKYAVILGGLTVVAKLLFDALSPKTDVEIAKVEAKIENIKIKADKLEVEKEEIKKEHQVILDKKKDRDKKAKKYFPNL